jgi:cytochrome b561
MNWRNTRSSCGLVAIALHWAVAAVVPILPGVGLQLLRQRGSASLDRQMHEST